MARLESRSIDLNGPTTNPRVEWFTVGDWTTVELVAHSPASSAVVELVRSPSASHPTLFVPTVELTTSSPTIFALWTRGVGYLGVRLKTAAGSAAKGTINVLTE